MWTWVDEVARIVEEDLSQLKAGNVKPTRGDMRCIAYGHLIRLAIWALRTEWDRKAPVESRIEKVADWLRRFGGWAEVEKSIAPKNSGITENMPLFAVHERDAEYGAQYADVPF